MLVSNQEVLVVGAGPSGLMMAVELARHGVGCRVIDRLPEATKESRALGVQARTLESLDLIGLANPLVERGVRVNAFRFFFEGGESGLIDLAGVPSKFNFLLAIPQAQTEALLTSRLAEQGVSIERGMEATSIVQREEAVRVGFSDGSFAEFDYVIGCDGAHSVVRESQCIPFEGEEYREAFILADLEIETNVPPDEAAAVIGDHGILGIFPLPGGLRRVVASVEGIGGDKPAAPTLDELRQMFLERFPAPVSLSNLVWSSGFRIHRRMVSMLRKGRCFLVGDSAHIHSPAGGQGMNTGLQDAMNLGWKIGLVIRGLCGSDLLNTYNLERIPIERQVLQLSDVLTKNVTMKAGSLKWLRRHLTPWFVHLPFIQRGIQTRISEVGINYAGGPLSIGHGSGGWGGISNMPGNSMHVLLNGAIEQIPAEWRQNVQIRQLGISTALVRPDGYVGATASFEEYFAGLEAGSAAHADAAVR